MTRRVPAVMGLCVSAAVLAAAGCTYQHRTVEVRSEAVPVMVSEPPPAPIIEPRPVAPTATSVWVDGYWHWDGRHYRWEKGHWERVPRGYTRWVAPRYERHDRDYRYVPGHWERER